METIARELLKWAEEKPKSEGDESSTKKASRSKRSEKNESPDRESGLGEVQI